MPVLTMTLPHIFTSKNGILKYRRRYPQDVAKAVGSQFYQCSLKTRDPLQISAAYQFAQRAFEHKLLLARGGASEIAKFEEAIQRLSGLGFDVSRGVSELGRNDGVDKDGYYDPNRDTGRDWVERIQREDALEGQGLAEFERAILERGARSVKPKQSLAEAIVAYIQENNRENNDNRANHRWRSRVRRAVQTFADLLPNGDRTPVDQITREHAYKWRDEVLRQIRLSQAQDKPLGLTFGSNETVNNYRKCIAAVLKHSFKVNEIERANPFDGLIIRLPVRFAEDARDAYTFAELEAWDEIMPQLFPEARLVISLCRTTGCRPVEACFLTPEDVRLEEAIPHIIIQPNRLNEGVMKGGGGNQGADQRVSRRRLPIVDEVTLDLLRSHPLGDGRYSKRGGNTNFTNYIGSKIRPVGLSGVTDDGRKISTYSFRHRFAQDLRDADVRSEIVEAILGHVVEGAGRGYQGEWRYTLEALEGPMRAALARRPNGR